MNCYFCDYNLIIISFILLPSLQNLLHISIQKWYFMIYKEKGLTSLTKFYWNSISFNIQLLQKGAPMYLRKQTKKGRVTASFLSILKLIKIKARNGFLITSFNIYWDHHKTIPLYPEGSGCNSKDTEHCEAHTPFWDILLIFWSDPLFNPIFLWHPNASSNLVRILIRLWFIIS